MDILGFVYIVVVIAITLFYAFMVLYYMLGWQYISLFKVSAYEPRTKLTVIIPARNEQDNIIKLLTCLQQQDYPSDLFEVIVVDDHSTDLTPELVETFDMPNLHLVHLKDYVSKDEMAYKKRAVETAVNQSTGELIICTDADCEMGRKWLYTYAAFYEYTQCKFIVAPVDYNNQTILDHLQTIDFLSIMGVTGASVYYQMYNLSNGANMAYEKQAFLSVNGYENADQSASGDDVFLIEKIGRKYPDGVRYLKNKDAIVYTAPASSFRALFQQRMRWISKTKHYTGFFTKFTAFLFLLYYLVLTCSFVLQFFYPVFLFLFLTQFITKIIVDFALVNEVTKFFNKRKLLNHFWLLQLTHYPFTLAVGVASQMFTYQWKDRKIKE